jgi:hypothetical protein
LAYHPKTRGYYLFSTVYKGTIDGKAKYKTVLFHRIIMNVTETKQVVDHLNHNTLDNRKNNLRIVTIDENNRNRRGANRNTSTGVRNVSYSKADNKYIIQLQVNGKNTVFGRFDSLEEATKLANIKRKEIYGYVFEESKEQEIN